MCVSDSEMLSDVGQACMMLWVDCYDKGGVHVEMYHWLTNEHFKSKLVPQIFSVNVDSIP